jgi:hypothetical protein
MFIFLKMPHVRLIIVNCLLNIYKERRPVKPACVVIYDTQFDEGK